MDFESYRWSSQGGDPFVHINGYKVPTYRYFVNTIEFKSAMIGALQIRMARAALGWGVRDLAKRTGLSPNTISRFENGAGAMAETVQIMQETLEHAGIMFIPADEAAGPGVRITERKKRKKG